jgi:hypothetical protein
VGWHTSFLFIHWMMFKRRDKSIRRGIVRADPDVILNRTAPG